MKWFINLLLLTLLCVTTGCGSLVVRCADGKDYYTRNSYEYVPGTNTWYFVNTFTVYHATCGMFDALGAPFRLGSSHGEEMYGNAMATLFYPLVLIDFPCELVFDTVFLPVDGYFHYKAAKENAVIRAKYGVE